jgi:hypothetical protein
MSTIAIHPSLAPERTRNSQVRLTPRGRLVARLGAVASLSILLLAGASLFTGATAGSSDGAATSPYMKITVKPGETLWSIAAKVDATRDRRDVIDELIEINRLGVGDVVAGQRIYIPTR